MENRKIWIEKMREISDPVIINLSKDKLKKKMPVKDLKNSEKEKFQYLEAFSRTFLGISSWLNLNEIEDKEEKEIQKYYIEMVKKCLNNATSKKAKDYMEYENGFQPLVDAAFLAQGLIRSYENIWCNLEDDIKQNIVKCLKKTRKIKPYRCNWLLFTAMIEVFFFKVGEDFDIVRIDYAIMQHEQWYKGDGCYGDGQEFHFDYYNSYVILPMMLEILEIIKEEDKVYKLIYENVKLRCIRYSEILERLISPEGTFPIIGRSVTYRYGNMHLLSLMAQRNEIGDNLTLGQIKAALTQVLKRGSNKKNFDDEGWLEVGIYGKQTNLGEEYINTGSLYLCSCIFTILGLNENSKFWQSDYEEWTNLKIWKGKDSKIDKALE